MKIYAFLLALSIAICAPTVAFAQQQEDDGQAQHFGDVRTGQASPPSPHSDTVDGHGMGMALLFWAFVSTTPAWARGPSKAGFRPSAANRSRSPRRGWGGE